LLVLAGTILARFPLAAAMMEGRRPAASGHSNRWVMRCGSRSHSGFWYLTAGFFVCGFQWLSSRCTCRRTCWT